MEVPSLSINRTWRQLYSEKGEGDLLGVLWSVKELPFIGETVSGAAQSVQCFLSM